MEIDEVSEYVSEKNLDRILSKIYNKKIFEKTGDYKTNLSISVKKRTKVEFLTTCYYAGLDPNQVISQCMEEVVEKHGLMVLIKRKQDLIAREQKDLSELQNAMKIQSQ